MANTLKMVYHHLHASIPHQILQLVFTTPQSSSLLNRTHHSPESIDDVIYEKVIKSIVLDDCNLVGGKQKQIFLKYYMHEPGGRGIQEGTGYMGHFSLYRIPPEDRDNQPILRVSHVDYPAQYLTGPYDTFRSSYGVNAKKLARAVLASHTGGGFLPTPKGEVIDGSLIRLFPAQHSHIDWVVTADIAYDPHFNSLNQEAVLSFRELVLCAVKSYIYNDLIISLDQGKIWYGGDVGAIRDIVQSYAEEKDKYHELLSEFSGGAILDIRKQNELIYMQV